MVELLHLRVYPFPLKVCKAAVVEKYLFVLLMEEVAISEQGGKYSRSPIDL